MSHGTLQVTVLEGRNLKDKDTFGQNDAYIELYLDKDYKQRTATIKDTNSPVWNQTFNFNLRKGEDHLHIKVYDEDVVGKDSIGSAKISLRKIQQAGGRLDEWVKLPAHLGLGSHGEVHLVLQLT
jgi:Ca2+-dependent lipid-binding protein